MQYPKVFMPATCGSLLALAALVALSACGGGAVTDSSSTAATATAEAPASSPPAAGAPAAPVATSAALDTSIAAAAAGLPTAPGGNTAGIGQFAAAELQRTLSEGRTIWRAQRLDINGVNKGACANCHSSDGVELAFWKFTDDDIRRRGHLDGVTATEREALVRYFGGLRQQYKITALKDVLVDRPFQPKGRPFDGTLAERDLQFATQTLAAVAPTLVNGVVDTLPKALQARAELKASNPLDMQIGIALPRVSEDCFRGAAHCSTNDWMADTPRIPKQAMSAQWFALNDTYLADPTDQNLAAVMVAIESMTDAWVNPGASSPAQAAVLGTEKFKSMQILQHFLRRQQLGLFKPADDQNPLAALRGLGLGLKRPNFPFLVGDFSFNKDGAPWTHGNEMPVFVRASLGEDATHPLTDAQVQHAKDEMNTPWWYAGFMFDAALGTGTNREYFFGNLGVGETGGYPFHLYYVVGKHGAIQTGRGTATAQGDPNLAMSVAAWKAIGEADQPRLFASIEARQLYRRMEANWTRMWMLLAKEQIQKSGLASLSSDQDLGLNLCAASGWASLREWVATSTAFDPEHAAATFGLYNELTQLARCNLPAFTASYQAGTGSGLLVEWFAGSGDEFNGKSSALTKQLGQRVEPILAFPGRETGSGYYAAWARSIGVDVVDNSAYSARGTGFVQAPVSGEYRFFLSGGFGKLSVGGKELYNEFRYNEGTPLRATITLQAGQRYPLVFERHGYAAGGMQLEWQTVDGALPRQKVPTLQLAPN